MDPNIRMDGYTDAERILVSRFIAEAKEQIRGVAATTTSDRLKKFFGYVADNLTSADLTVSSAIEAAGLNGDYSAKIFQITRMRPKAFVDHHRAMLGRRIIQHVNAFISDVAFSIGFEDPSSFTRWYSRVLGNAPGEEKKVNTLDSLTVKGDPRFAESTEVSLGSSLNLEDFWRDVCSMPSTEITLYLHSRVDHLRVDHFRFLLEKAKFIGRMDIDRSGVLVEASIQVLRLIEFWDRENLSEQVALGYGHLANVRRRQSDNAGAIACLEIADQHLPTDPADTPVLHSQVSLFRAGVLWWQGEPKSATELIHEILPAIRRHGSSELLARTLLLKADILDSCGQPEKAIPLLSEALSLKNFLDDSYVVFTAHYNLAYLLLKSSKSQEATEAVGQVIELYPEVSDQVPPAHISFLEGSLNRLSRKYRRAESFLLEAQKGFEALGLDLQASLVSLELALLYLESGNSKQACSVTVEALPVISQFSVHQEATTAFAILQESVARDRVSRPVLSRAIRHLELIRKDPAFQPRLKV